ncbi:hypothetical protein LLG10_06455 [bacterium]|nr:hypothetical protein [bacterium]
MAHVSSSDSRERVNQLSLRRPISLNRLFSILSGLADTSKTNQSYSYAYSTSKELNELDYPNTLELHQTWSSKMLDLLTVTDASQQTTYLSSDATYNANEQMSDYDFSVNAGQNTFSEAYDLAYDTKGRLSTMETDSSSRTLTYGYDAYNGQLTSLAFSDLGTYGIDYLGNGNIDTITYPSSQGIELYAYDGGKGRLSEIAYPNDDILEFQWNAKDQVSRLDYYDDSADSTESYVLVYNDLGRLDSSTHMIDSITQSVWTYAWGLHGLEKATKTVNGQTALTQDYTTDPQGRILSMTYTTPGEGYDGELYFHYDHFGNTTLLADTNGSPVFSAQYNPCRGTTLQTWNTNSLEIMNLGQGRTGTISMSLPGSYTALLASSGTITISEEAIAAFVARAGTNLVCYIEDGFGLQEGNPDENPCDCTDTIYSSTTELCDCNPPLGYYPEDMENKSCEDLKKDKQGAKDNWESHQDEKHPGNIDNILDILVYIANKNLDYPCQSMARDGCLYWRNKEELERRQSKGECLDFDFIRK